MFKEPAHSVQADLRSASASQSEITSRKDVIRALHIDPGKQAEQGVS